MKVAFRVDSSQTLGTGHLRRCLRLAEALRTKGHECLFFCAELQDHQAALIQSQSFQVELLESSLSFEEELNALKNLFRTHGPFEWIVLDHYERDVSYEEKLRTLGRRLLVIDDLGRSHHCDVLVDPSELTDLQKYQDKMNLNGVIFVGPRYGFVDQRILNKRPLELKHLENIESVLVFLGGSATKGFEKLASALNQVHQKLRVTVLSNLSHLDDVFKGLNHEIKILSLQDDFSELLLNHDLYLGSAGSITWDRFVLGLAGLVVTVADNQKDLAEKAHDLGAQITLGDLNQLEVEFMAKEFNSLVKDPERVNELRLKAFKFAVPNGSEILSFFMNRDLVEFKKASEEDAKNIFEWRSHPLVSHFSTDINYDDHLQWMKSTLKNKNRDLLIGYQYERPLGVIRFDHETNRSEVSIYMVPDCLGKGLGPYLLKAAEQWLRDHHQEIKIIEAKVHEDNKASHHLFQSLNYKWTGSLYEKSVNEI